MLLEGKSIIAAARDLGIRVSTAPAHVSRLALQLPNPHGLPAHRLILSYFESLPRVEIELMTTRASSRD